jgi:hypothetical protein
MAALVQLLHHTLAWLQQAVTPKLGGPAGLGGDRPAHRRIRVLLPLAVRQARSVRAQRALRPQLNRLQASLA